ncbi:MAG: IPT/TIG domain-containing protein [Verrucomicrobia bacterium]|nr:IPT/TIG domain-containing protein [Verrucomicrobiota bacterium]
MQRACFTTTARNEIALEFGQAMAWNSAATVNLFLDKAAGKVSSGSASGNVIKLRLTGASTAQSIDYLEDASWDGSSASLLRGSNGIAALTFADVPIEPPAYAPAITSLAPVSGRTNGGTVVTLTGSNFLSGATVQFGGSIATAVTVDSTAQMTATTPAHGSGLVNVTVLNTNGLSATNQFNYVLPPPSARLSNAVQVETDLMILWAGGTNQPCLLLSGSNVTQPLATWSPVATNAVGPNGMSTNTIPIQPDMPQRFYLLSIPYN